MRTVFLMLLVASAASADTRLLKDEAMAMIDALAKKYDCHTQEANLVDTLGKINKKNADGQAALKQQCQEERATAERAKEDATAKAVSTYKNTTGKLEAKLDKALTRTTNQLAKITGEHADKVTEAIAAEQTAVADFDAKKKEWIKETDDWIEAGLNYSATVGAADMARNTTIGDAKDARETSDKFAEAENTQEIDNAQKQQNVTITGTCEPIFSSDTAMLNRDNATIGEVDTLLRQLQLCREKKEHQGNAATEAPAAAAMLETESRALRGSFETESVLLETGVNACLHIHTKLRAVAEVPADSPVTGHISDMKKRLTAERATVAARHSTCLSDAKGKYEGAVAKANAALNAAKAASKLALEEATKAANAKFEGKKLAATNAKRKAKAEYDAAKLGHENALASKTEAIGARQGAEKNRDDAVKEETRWKEDEDNKSRKKHDDGMKKAEDGKNQALTDAHVTYASSLSDIDTKCKQEQEQYEAEASTVLAIQDSLSKLGKVSHDCGARTGAKAGSAVWCRCNSKRQLIASKDACENRGGSEDITLKRSTLCSWDGGQGKCLPKEVPKPAPPVKVCCKAKTAGCMACNADMTEKEFCALHPGTTGCE